ncbi:MAG: SDR family NAD(P)-dependent oxidoreductase [Sarcina sp.]
MKSFVLITGATSGIGLELAKIYSENNYNLILVGRNTEVLNSLGKQFNNVETITYSLDLSNLDNVDYLIEDIKRRQLKVGILINNAGIGFNGEFLTIPWENQETVIELNIKSLTKLTYGILEEMKKVGQGKILNIASTGAYQPGPLISVYYATKAYVLSFSVALREELKEYGIVVSTVCPGATKTQFSKRAGKGDLDVAMSAEVVAYTAYRGLNKNKGIIIPGVMNKVLVFLSKISPTIINGKVVKKIQGKAMKK